MRPQHDILLYTLICISHACCSLILLLACFCLCFPCHFIFYCLLCLVHMYSLCCMLISCFLNVVQQAKQCEHATKTNMLRYRKLSNEKSKQAMQSKHAKIQQAMQCKHAASKLVTNMLRYSKLSNENSKQAMQSKHAKIQKAKQ